MARVVHLNDPSNRILTLEEASRNLGPEQILKLLKERTALEDSLTLDNPQLRELLDTFVAQGMDFGSIYARVRQYDPKLYPTVFEYLSEADTCGSECQWRREAAVSGQTIRYPRNIVARRLWDLHAYRVVPLHYAFQHVYATLSFWAISHSWTDDMGGVDTDVNGHEWLVPLPAGMSLETVRNEMLNLGAQYVWLDVLCLRQFSEDPISEDKRKQEWTVDVPTIGFVYSDAAERIVRYMNGLGRAFERSGWDNPRHWLNRTWTLPETLPDSITAGGPEGEVDPEKERSIETGELLSDIIKAVEDVEPAGDNFHTIDDFMAIIRALKRRFSTNPVDKIATAATRFCREILPMYNEAESEEDAWARCVRHLPSSTIGNLLFGFTTLGDGAVTWRPSWRQLMDTDEPKWRPTGHWIPVNGVNAEGHVVYRGPSLTAHLIPRVRDGESEHRQAVLQILFHGNVEEIEVTLATSAPVVAEGEYVIVGHWSWEEWLLGIKLEGPRLQKVAVFDLKEDELKRMKSIGSSVNQEEWHFV